MDAIAEQLLARLRVDPRDRDAYDALRAHYVHSQDLASLADLLESWAVGHADDRQLASDAWTEAADAVLQSGGDRSRAKTLYRRALELNVLHPRAGERLRELLETDTDFKGLVEILDPYARALESAGGAPNYIAGLYQRLAELWQHAFERPDIAESYRQRAAELSGGGSRLGASSQDDDARKLADDYERRAAAEAEPERKAALYLELAKVRQGRRHDLDGAILALREARSAAPTDLLIMHQLASALLTQSQRLEPQAARLAQRRAGELFYQIAQAIDEAQALPYLESALASMPDHEGSLAMLERVAPAQGQAQVLPSYWVRFVASAGDGPEADQRRLWLGRAYLQAGQFEDAIYCLQPAVEHHFEGADELLAQAYAGLGSDPGFTDSSSAFQPLASALLEGPALAFTAGAVPEPLSAEAREPARVLELRKRVRAALAARYNDEAAEHCRAILAIDPADGEAFNLLESHLRKRGDYVALRELLLGTTRVSALPIDTRRVRLREVALLSEGKLRDAETALSAWNDVLMLDPSDHDAASHLKRLLYKAQRWDELCAVLEREALATTELDPKVVVLRELAHLHRDKRKDALQTAEVLRKLHSLLPDDAGLRAEFCEALIAIEQWTDAVPLLRDCIAHSKEEHDELKYSHLLASVLHEKLSALEDAHRVCLQILDFKPADKSAFERMERIDEESGNHARLLATLERRALLAAKSERPALLIRMASIAERRLHDLDKAAGYLGDALDLSPEDDQALNRLCEMLQDAGRADRLLDMLRERSQLPGSSRARAAVLRRMADTQLRTLQDHDGAAASYRKLLELEEDERALRFLRDFAARKADMQQLCDVLQRLALCVTDVQERRDLLFERAVALHERLSSLAEAVATLKHILERLDPSFEPAIELLLALSVRNRDAAGLALALERKLQLAGPADARLPLIKRLADAYEHEIGDGERAIGALEQWTRQDPVDPEPYRRMRALLLAAQKWSALLVVLDALKEREDSPETRDQSAIEGARIAFERLADIQGAWRRLVPLLEQRNLQAAALLHEIAGQSNRQSELAALYIQLAQKSGDGPIQANYWRTAAEIFERELHDPNQALEASLRMLATDLDNRDFLAHVDRLAAATKAFRRLSQVYDRLLKHEQAEVEQIKLLERLADVLEHDHPEEALARVLQACKLAPLDDALLVRAESLAQRGRRSEELLPLYDRRSESTPDHDEKVRMMLRAARLCDGALRDREQATHYLRKALGMAGASAQLSGEVESAARELDWARPDLGKDNARRALVRSYRETAQHAEPELAERLVLRGTQLLQSELDDERSAFDMLLQGISMLPCSDALYSALRAMADTRGRLDAIDAQLARSIEDATDLPTSMSVLRRRGSLLEDALGRFQDAAAVYAKLVVQNPDDTQASDRLRVNLRRSGRYQELLSALGRQLQRTQDEAARLGLLKEVAGTWETDLRNRWEALDAWKLVLAEQPQDRDAQAALERLERGQPGLAERGASRPESTVSFAVSEPSKPREIAIGDRRSEPSSALPPKSARETDPMFAALDGPAADPNESEAEPDDLAALDADVSARMPAVEEIDGFDDMEGIPDLEIRASLPLPPATRSLLPAVERVTPPPPPPRPMPGAPPARRPPPPPPSSSASSSGGDSPSTALPALPKSARTRGGVSE